MNDMPPPTPPPEPVRLPETDKTPEAPRRDGIGNTTQPSAPDLRTFSAAPSGKERADAPQNASIPGNDSASSRMTTDSEGRNTVVTVDQTRTAQSKTEVVGSTPGKPGTPENAPATPNTPEKDRLASDSQEKDRSG